MADQEYWITYWSVKDGISYQIDRDKFDNIESAFAEYTAIKQDGGTINGREITTMELSIANITVKTQYITSWSKE